METLTIVLTGGRSTRMGGRHKPALLVGGSSIVDRAGAAAPGRVVIAGSGEGL
ncbi:NTP transferase domain-containing protein, partial [Microbacterium gubbeenense]|uniref:NTP transferase domain-containing protein n=1 Tax=Microbacterium gubbeenense TaxID=159896 RepID=UPI003F998A8F